MTTPYQDYLKSDAWRARAEDALLRASHRCQLCYSGERLEVHHRTYIRLGREEPTDLTVLCHSCHSKFHGKSDDYSAREKAERHIIEAVNAIPANTHADNTEAEPCN